MAGINIELVEEKMKVLRMISQGLELCAKAGVCLSIEPKTVYLAIALHEARARGFICASNSRPTKGRAVAALREAEVGVFARASECDKDYKKRLNQVLDEEPIVVVDGDGDLGLEVYRKGLRVGELQKRRPQEQRGTELLELQGLPFSVIEPNGARCKPLFNNCFGTGQSVLERA